MLNCGVRCNVFVFLGHTIASAAFRCVLRERVYSSTLDYFRYVYLRL